MYVSDVRERTREYIDLYGFRLAGRKQSRDHETTRLRHGLATFLLTQGRTASHPAAVFTERHGDGVGNIGLRVADSVQTLRHAVAAGASRIGPQIAAFGDVTHTFVDSGRWPASQHRRAAAVGMPRIDHVAVCLQNGELDATVDFYQRVLGWRQIFEENIEVGAQAMQSKVVQSWSGGATLTFLQPVADVAPGQIDDFLTWHGGTGVQHIALAVHDIVRTVDDLSRRGVRFLASPGAYYRELSDRMPNPGHPVSALELRGILADQDHDGQLFQIFTRSEHPRRTFFMEIIERQGARTFGSNNIRRLYEAVEREQALAATPGSLP